MTGSQETIFELEEGHFRTIFQSSNEGILIVSPEGKILLANPVSEQIFGYENDEMKGKGVEDLVPGHLRKKHTT